MIAWIWWWQNWFDLETLWFNCCDFREGKISRWRSISASTPVTRCTPATAGPSSRSMARATSELRGKTSLNVLQHWLILFQVPVQSHPQGSPSEAQPSWGDLDRALQEEAQEGSGGGRLQEEEQEDTEVPEGRCRRHSSGEKVNQWSVRDIDISS